MNERNLDQLLNAWMDLGPITAPDRVADAARLEASTTRQTAIPMWWPPRRFPFMNTTAKVALATAAVIIAAILGYNYVIAPNVGGPSLSEPSPSPSVSPNLVPLTEGGLEPGTYSLADGFPVGLTFELPAGWGSCSNGVLEQGVCQTTGVGPGVGVTFLVVENVVADPCNGAVLLDPPVGPSVDDLVTGVSNLAGFEATSPEDVTVSGYAGKAVTITAPGDAGCDLFTVATPDRTNGVAPGEISRLYIVDVNGVRIVISSVYFATSADELSAADDVVASIEIEP